MTMSTTGKSLFQMPINKLTLDKHKSTEKMFKKYKISMFASRGFLTSKNI